MQRRVALALLVAALGVAAAAPAAPSDGKINGHYSPKCLRTAIKKAPEDLRDYSSLIDDINAALIDALPAGKHGGGPNGGRGGRGGPGGGPAIPGATGSKQGSIRAAKNAVAAAGTPASDPGHNGSFPLPLILFGAIVLAGALAAASPALYKRFRTRFPRLRPTPGSVRPPA